MRVDARFDVRFEVRMPPAIAPGGGKGERGGMAAAWPPPENTVITRQHMMAILGK